MSSIGKDQSPRVKDVGDKILPHPPGSISSKLVLASGCRSSDLGVKIISWNKTKDSGTGTGWTGRSLGGDPQAGASHAASPHFSAETGSVHVGTHVRHESLMSKALTLIFARPSVCPEAAETLPAALPLPPICPHPPPHHPELCSRDPVLLSPDSLACGREAKSGGAAHGRSFQGWSSSPLPSYSRRAG